MESLGSIDAESNPEPKHWPDYAAPMPPIPHALKADAKKIARSISSLNRK
jgi:hypothetical protein